MRIAETRNALEKYRYGKEHVKIFKRKGNSAALVLQGTPRNLLMDISPKRYLCADNCSRSPESIE